MNDIISPASSCKAILHFMNEITQDPSAMKTRALFQDLAWKAQSLRPSIRRNFIEQGLGMLVDRTLDSLGCWDLVNGIAAVPRPPKFDIGCVAVLSVELKAVLVALGGRPEESGREDCRVGAQRYWLRTIRRHGKRPLSAVVTFVGQARNVPCAIAAERLLQKFPVRSVVLVGIAAGLKSKVAIGDVVCADRVIDYEHVRQELSMRFTATKRRDGTMSVKRNRVRTERRRPLHMNLDPAILQDLRLFSPATGKIEVLCRKDLRTLEPNAAIPWKQHQPMKYHHGTIASGEKLIADGSLVDLRLHFDERLRAADQDSSGFAQACELREPKVPWAIFRGISDYGDGTKKKIISRLLLFRRRRSR